MGSQSRCLICRKWGARYQVHCYPGIFQWSLCEIITRGLGSLVLYVLNHSVLSAPCYEESTERPVVPCRSAPFRTPPSHESGVNGNLNLGTGTAGPVVGISDNSPSVLRFEDSRHKCRSQPPTLICVFNYRLSQPQFLFYVLVLGTCKPVEMMPLPTVIGCSVTL